MDKIWLLLANICGVCLLLLLGALLLHMLLY